MPIVQVKGWRWGRIGVLHRVTCPAKESGTPHVRESSADLGSGEELVLKVGTGGGRALASSLPLLSHILLLADSEQHTPNLNASITCLFEEKIGLKWPGAFSLQFRRREGSGLHSGQGGREWLLNVRVFSLSGPPEAATPGLVRAQGMGRCLGQGPRSGPSCCEM